MKIAAAPVVLVLFAPCAAKAADMRAECARIGTLDRARAIGAELVEPARALFGLSASAPAEFVRASTVARCMGGKVWLCNAGANIPCGKADARRDNPGAAAFCKDNPNAAIVPMAATGHATIYAFRCAAGRARVERRFGEVDARGFVAGAWKRLR